MVARILLLVAALALLAPACTQDSEDPPTDDATPADDPACDPEVDAALRAWAGAGFSGTVAISTAGELTCEAAYGSADHEEGRPNTTDTVFAIGSVSKAFAAAAVLDLVAAGDLALDDRAGDLVPGLGGPAAGATVEQLLLHTSGLSGDVGADGEPLAAGDAVAALGRLEQAAPAGTEHLYSNAGYTLLALIVQEVTGTPYRDHLEAVLTVDGDVLGGFWDGEPAAPGPRAVGYDEDDRPSPDRGEPTGSWWATAGNGDLAMTTTELARWTHALFTGAVVSPAAVALLEETTFAHDDADEVPGWVRFDAGRFGEPLYGTAGGGGDVGHVAVTAWLPESERVVAVSSNTAEVTAEDLLAELAPALVAGDPLPRPEGAAAEVDPEEVARAVGSYAVDGGDRLEVAADDDGLRVEATGPAAVAALFPPVDEADAQDRAAHEERVESLLAGETAAGREELATLEEDLGPIDGAAVVGTIDAGELRTYVRLAADDEALAWYALDEAGGIQGVEITDHLPGLVVGPAGSGTYRPVDPTGGPEVALAFTDDGLTVTGPAGTVTATRR